MENPHGLMGLCGRGVKASASVDGLKPPDKPVNPGCWLRSGFESQLVICLYLNPISYGHVNRRANKFVTNFQYTVSPVLSSRRMENAYKTNKGSLYSEIEESLLERLLIVHIYTVT